MSISPQVVETFLNGITRAVNEARHGPLLNATDHKLMCFLLKQRSIDERLLRDAIGAGLQLSTGNPSSQPSIDVMYNRLIQAPTNIPPEITHECKGLACPCDTLT